MGGAMEAILLQRKQVEEMCGLSRSMIYKMMGQGRFPRPLQLGIQCVRWRAVDIESYIESLPFTKGEVGAETVSA